MAGALKQLGIGVLGIGVAVVTVFVLSNVTVRVLAAFMGGITAGDTEGDVAGARSISAAEMSSSLLVGFSDDCCRSIAAIPSLGS